MKTMIKLLNVCAVGALAVSMPAVVEAQPRPKPAVVKAPKKPPVFRNIKAKMKQLKSAGKTAYRNLKATHRSEGFNRQRKQQFEARYVAARDAYTANPSQASYQTALARHQEYLGAKEAHDASLNAWNAAKTAVNRTYGDTLIEPNAARTQGALPPPKPPQSGAPKMRVQARVQQIRSGAAVAPNPRAMLRGTGPVARREVVAGVRDPQPIGNPANFPAAALAPQRAQQLNNQLRQWQNVQLNEFNQQLAAGRQAPGAQNGETGYFNPGPPEGGIYGGAPASVNQTHLYTPASAPLDQSRPVVQNAYDVVVDPMRTSNNRIITPDNQGVQPTQPGQIQTLPQGPN